MIPEINALACMFTAISGVQFLLFGMWFDMQYNRENAPVHQIPLARTHRLSHMSKRQENAPPTSNYQVRSDGTSVHDRT